MKKIILLAAFVLSGCAQFTAIWPIAHDGAMFDRLVDVKVAVDNLSCTDKKWDDAFHKVEHLRVYATYKNDPQAPSVTSLNEALKKAHGSNNVKFCESVLAISKTRIDVIADAWKGRK